jgi:hypothetical protein
MKELHEGHDDDYYEEDSYKRDHHALNHTIPFMN